jgi:hypothetical protein
MCLNVKAFGAVAELHPYKVRWRNIAISLIDESDYAMSGQ